MAVRKRTIDNAPTIPRESTTFDVTAKITRVEIIVSATRVTPNEDEYITPEKVFLYIKKINMPMPKASVNARTISNTVTLEMFSKKLDLKIS
ncbi:hypothetical protein IMSAGC013_01056 [Lachnospiraceae bacterium]|nr:hypothetical protein IMSAGC013_01056 [Lachnospiraceae bacterium]